MWRAAVSQFAVLSIVALAPGLARAIELSPSSFHQLAIRAANGDGVALAQLRDTTSVGGRPVALGAILQMATPVQIQQRLLALAAAGPIANASSAAARARAASILSEPRYGKATVPDPLLSLLGKLGHAIASLASRAPGGPLIFWILAAAVVVGLSAFVARRALRRLSGPAGSSAIAAPITGEDPRELAGAADAAEARGAFADAIRLRFRAGLLTLGERGAIDYRPSLLNADAARRLRSSQFDSLAQTFEQVTYGNAPAAPTDASQARDGWDALLSRTGAER